MTDEDDARRSVSHQLGERLDDLSVADLDARVALLRDEIARLEAAKAAKQDAAAAAACVLQIVTEPSRFATTSLAQAGIVRPDRARAVSTGSGRSAAGSTRAGRR